MPASHTAFIARICKLTRLLHWHPPPPPPLPAPLRALHCEPFPAMCATSFACAAYYQRAQKSIGFFYLQERIDAVESSRIEYDSSRKELASAREAQLKHARKTDGKVDATLQAHEAQAESILAGALSYSKYFEANVFQSQRFLKSVSDVYLKYEIWCWGSALMLEEHFICGARLKLWSSKLKLAGMLEYVK